LTSTGKNIVDTVRNSYPEFLLANHSYSHGFRNNYKFFYSHPDSAVKDFIKAQSILNVPVKIVRFPGNNMWIAKGEIRGPKSTRKVAEAMDSLGFNAIGWDVEWQFKEQHGSVPIQGAEQLANSVNEMFENMITNQPNHLVILAHDRMFAKPQYADSLIHFINILKQDPRNVFETVDHYPNLK